MFTLDQQIQDILVHWLIASMATTEVVTREPQREATGTTAVPMPTDHSTSYPGGGASKTIMAVAIPTFQPARCAKLHENQVIGPKNGGHARDLDSCITVAVPPMAF